MLVCRSVIDLLRGHTEETGFAFVFSPNRYTILLNLAAKTLLTNLSSICEIDMFMDFMG